MMEIRIASSNTQIQGCISALRQLRADVPGDLMLERVRRQMTKGEYRLAYVEKAGEVKAAAGFRISENLAWGRFMYIDDLVTVETERSRGFGGALFDWLVAHAEREGCGEVHLDSGVHRFDAHRFYLGKGMRITSHHFSVALGDKRVRR